MMRKYTNMDGFGWIRTYCKITFTICRWYKYTIWTIKMGHFELWCSFLKGVFLGFPRLHVCQHRVCIVRGGGCGRLIGWYHGHAWGGFQRRIINHGAILQHETSICSSVSLASRRFPLRFLGSFLVIKICFGIIRIQFFPLTSLGYPCKTLRVCRRWGWSSRWEGFTSKRSILKRANVWRGGIGRKCVCGCSKWW